ncbi:MAG: ABC transporter permease, partial [Gammaproteobacteria bacterium]|nr:ABC transporter permease [Gammaproteobacteria bacterium]
MNIFSMMIGISCALITLIYVNYEFSYENWITDADNIYRVEQTYHYPGSAEASHSFVSANVAPTIDSYFSQIKSTTRALWLRNITLKSGKNTFLEDIAFVDSNFLNFFSLTLVQGDKIAALKDPSSILLSESMAKKYFGLQPAVGKIISAFDNKNFLVNGVFKDLPANTHLNLDFIALYSESSFEQIFPEENFYYIWNIAISNTYFKLLPDADISSINDRLDDYVNKHFVHQSPERATATPSDYVTFSTRPITDIHLYSPNWEAKPSNTSGMVIGFALIALLILIVAIINYASLATATSSLRAREIGLRKIMGATLNQIRAQFISEALIIAMLGAFLALVLTELMLPFAAQFLDLDLKNLPSLTSPPILLTTFVIALISGLLAGIYPAFYLATIRPVRVLSANKSKEQATSWLRSMLLVS